MSAAAFSRVLLGVGHRPTARLAVHAELHGPMPDLRRWAPSQLVDAIERAGLRGHGGAAFPTGRKMRSVIAQRGHKVVLANGAEGEPASKKDRVLLRETPHLVLDGAALAARAVGAKEVVLAVADTDERGARALQLAIRERSAARLRGEPRWTELLVPSRYVSGQETALINLINTGVAKPTFVGPHPFERGVRSQPTLVQNIETLAHIALIVRHGPEWFRQLGTADDPGTTMVTVSGDVGAPGVYEIEHGTALAELLRIADSPREIAGVLIGGYFGIWLRPAAVPRIGLASRELATAGASLGAGVIAVLRADACPVAETSRVADYLAAESAGQCGPCVHGLAAIADSVQRLATGTAPARAFVDLERWTAEVPRRGACAHPDGAVRFVASALAVFAHEFGEHARHGPCERCSNAPVLPTPAVAAYGLAA